jgi:hypothetical protein
MTQTRPQGGIVRVGPGPDRRPQRLLAGRRSSPDACGPCPRCGKRPDRVSHKRVGRRPERAAHTAHKAPLDLVSGK